MNSLWVFFLSWASSLIHQLTSLPVERLTWGQLMWYEVIMASYSCSELSSGLYCRVKWPRRQLWTSYSLLWELEISRLL
jgi:hypothetical protein